MASLQQASVDIVGSGAGFGLVAYHRRCGCLLSYSKDGVFTLHQRIPHQLNAKWKAVSSFQAQRVFCNVVAVLPVECFDVFAFVGMTKAESVVAIVDLQGNLKSIYVVSGNNDLCCGEFNQKSREFILGFRSSNLVCFCLSQPRPGEYQIVRRKSLSITIEVSQPAVQIVSQDLVGTVLVLTQQGNIVCLDATNFDVIHTIFRHVFSMGPCRLWVDRFGTSFAVQCSDERGAEQLEFWSPPRDYTSCHLGAFDRAIIPLSAKLINVSLESLGVYGGSTLLVTATADRMAHLWNVLPSRLLVFENSIRLNMPAVDNADDMLRDDFFMGLSRQVSAMSFVPSSSAAASAVFMTSCGGAVASVNVLLPQQGEDMLYRQLLLRTESRLPAAPIRLSALDELPSLDDNRPAAAMTSQVLVLNMDDHGDVLHPLDVSRSPFRRAIEDESSSTNRHHLHDDRLQTPPLTSEHSRVRERPPEPLVLLEGRSVMTDTLSELASHTFPPAPVGAYQSTLPVVPNKVTGLLALFAVDYFLPEYFLNQRTNMAKSAAKPKSALKLIPSKNLLWRGDDRLELVTAEGLIAISASGLMHQPMSMDSEVSLCGVAHRSGLLAVVTSLKECLVYKINDPKKPLYLPVSIRHQTAIRSLAHADVLIREPLKSKNSATVAVNKSAPIKGTATASSAALCNRFSIVFVGDTDGFIHYFITNRGDSLMQSDRFRAHTAPVQHIVVTGDAARAQWTVGSEVDMISSKAARFNIVPSAGSALITVSADGEVKCWQPHGLDGGSASMEQLFCSANMRWRLSGVFTVGPRSSVPSSAKSNVSGREVSGQRKSIECIALGPGCMHVIIGTNTGEVEQWAIPGVVETTDSSLSTMQKPVWTAVEQVGLITSARVYIHGELSEAREIVFRDDQDRDMMLASLSAFVRVPVRTNRTLGYGYQELKSMRDCSSLVTCSFDCSVVVWGFETVFQSYCSSLCPSPKRRLFFSNVPHQGIAYCLNTQTNHPQLLSNIWCVSVLVDGILHSVLEATRESLFNAADPALTDNRDASLHANIMRFEDDILFDPNKPATPAAVLKCKTGKTVMQPHEPLTMNPVVAVVLKPPQLVACTKLSISTMQEHELNKMLKPGADAVGTNLYISSKLLEEWARINSTVAVPILQYDAKHGEALLPAQNMSAKHFDVAVESLPVRPTSPSPLLLVDQQPTTQVAGLVQRPSSPSRLDVVLPADAKGGAALPDRSIDTNTWEMKKLKFVARGLHLEANNNEAERTRALIEQVLRSICQLCVVSLTFIAESIWTVCLGERGKCFCHNTHVKKQLP